MAAFITIIEGENGFIPLKNNRFLRSVTENTGSPEQRQAAFDNAVDEGDHFLPAVFVIVAR